MMKNLTFYLISILGILMLSSCDKRDIGPTANPDPSSFSITSPKSNQSYTLSKEKANDTLFTMQWTKPDYGFASAPNYTIKMGTTKSDSGYPITLGTTNKTSFSITVGEMNSKLLGADISTDQQTTLNSKVIASLGDSVETVSSQPIAMSIQPYAICKYCPQIYVPGGYQAASGYETNWTPAVAPALQSINGSDIYEGYVYMANTNNEYKFTPERNFNADFGDTGQDGTLDPTGDNIKQAKSGYFKIHVNLNKLTYALTDTKWSITGDAADGYGKDIFMTYDPSKKIWTKTLDLKAKSIKFRANQSYDINYGDNGADGTLEQDGANISVPSAGIYTVTLNLSAYPYTYLLQKN